MGVIGGDEVRNSGSMFWKTGGVDRKGNKFVWNTAKVQQMDRRKQPEVYSILLGSSRNAYCKCQDISRAPEAEFKLGSCNKRKGLNVHIID